MLILAAALGLGLGAAGAPKPPPAAGGLALLDVAAQPPRVAFSGKKLVVTWFGKQSRASEVRVYFKPPDLWRHEVLSPSGKVLRVSIEKGQKEWVWREDKTEIVEHDVPDNEGLDADALRRLLVQNHLVEARGVQDILRRRAAGLEILPKLKAGSKLELWVEPETGIVLRRRQSDLYGTWVHESRFVSLEESDDLPDSMFDPASETSRRIVRPPARREISSKAELEQAGFGGTPWLAALPFGFTLQSVAMVPVKGGVVAHFRYTNGLSLVSLFVSKTKISPSSIGAPAASPGSDSDYSGASWVGNVVGWREGKLHYVLIGEMNPKSLHKLRWAVRGGSRLGRKS